MSSSTVAVPIVVRRADPNAHLPSDYGVTPHGTIFSTTPGGTRIIYDRAQLLKLRNSPYSQSPPAALKFIPGVTRASLSGIGAGMTSPLTQTFHASEAPDMNRVEEGTMSDGTESEDDGREHGDDGVGQDLVMDEEYVDKEDAKLTLLDPDMGPPSKSRTDTAAVFEMDM